MKKCYYISVFIIILIAIYARASSGFEPIIDPDVEGYIYPALSWIKDNTFIHVSARSFPYPLFCTLILAPTKSFAAIVLAQFILGILSIILLAVLFRKWIVCLRAPVIISHILALLLLLFVALLPQEIIFERSIRPEAIIGFFFSLFLYTMSVFLIDKDRRAGLVVVLVVFNCFMYLLFPRWGFCLPFVMGMIAWYCFRSDSRQRMFIHYFIGLILSFILLYLPEQRLIDKYDSYSKTFLIRQYFYVHVGIIAENIGSEDKNLLNSNMDKKVYKYINDSLPNILKENRNRSMLGYNPDVMMYGAMDKTIDSLYFLNYDSVLFKSQWGFYPRELNNRKSGGSIDSLIKVGKSKNLDRQFNDDKYEWEKNFLSKIIFNSIRYNYKDYPIKLYKQLAFYYASGKIIMPDSYESHTISHMTVFSASIGSFSPNGRIEEYPTEILFPSVQCVFCNCINYIISYTFLLLSAISIIFVFVNMNKAINKSVGWFLLLHFFLVLTVSFIHTFDNDRYSPSIYIPAIFCYFLMIIYIPRMFEKEKLP